MTHRGTFAVGLLVAATLAHAAEPPPTSRPAVPALVAGEAAFVVVGRVGDDDGSLGFEIASDRDGARRIVLFDAADGTPIFLSDGARTLVYDLTGNRVALLSPSSGLVRVDWDPAAEKPMTFTFKVQASDDAAKLAEEVSHVRLDRFAETAEPRDGGRRLERASRNALAVLTPTADGFRLTSGDPTKPPRLELVARGVGGAGDPARLAFPDVARLRADGVAVEEVTGGRWGTLLIASAATGGGMGAKLGLAMGGELRDKAAHVAGGEDVLLRRDATLGTAYRAALAKQDIAFGPATRPTD